MRFMILRKADANTEAGVMPSEQLLAAMQKYMEELSNAGGLLDGDGLHPSSKAARVSFSEGKPTVIDGPFTETKERIAGYTTIQDKTMGEATAWGRRGVEHAGGGAAQR